MLNPQAVPFDWPVRPLPRGVELLLTTSATCGSCGLSWDDAEVTSMTPAPAARCPFEPFHESEDDAGSPAKPSPYDPEPKAYWQSVRDAEAELTDDDIYWQAKRWEGA